MRYVVTALALSALSTPVLAQATPPGPPAPSSSTATSTDTSSGPSMTGRLGGRGAFIKMQGPGGAEVMVRCADGESTRACADVVMQLLEKVRGAGPERRRDMDRGERGDRGGESRFRDREY